MVAIADRDHRCRELFPLPAPHFEELDWPVAGPKAKRHALGLQREIDAVESLNDIISVTGLECAGPPALGSSDAAARVCATVREFTAGFEPAEAAKESVARILGAPLNYDGSEADSQQMGSYDREKVALPSAKEPPMMVSDMLDAHASQHIVDFASLILRSTAEMQEVNAEKPPAPYWDPRLGNSRKRYLDFVLLLAEMNIIGFTQRPAQEVGCFFVKKKDGRLRLIVDARPTNHRCRLPPSMQVGGTGSWSTLRIPEGSELYTAQYDVEAYFYRLGIPPEIGRYFALKEVPP